MQRYHNKICFPKKYDNQLRDIISQFNNMKHFKRTNHAIDNIGIRFNMMEVLQFLKDSVYFKYEYIFEYYVLNDNIQKICFKIPYNQYNDLILVLSNEKAIITLYLNSKGDNHKTLKMELYSTI